MYLYYYSWPLNNDRLNPHTNPYNNYSLTQWFSLVSLNYCLCTRTIISFENGHWKLEWAHPGITSTGMKCFSVSCKQKIIWTGLIPERKSFWYHENLAPCTVTHLFWSISPNSHICTSLWNKMNCITKINHL